MTDWECELVPIDNVQSDPQGFGTSEHKGAAGTFSKYEGQVYITYGMSGLARPESLVATFAHELSHQLMHSVDALPPGGEQAEEPATDLCAVFLGFGIFVANAAFSYEGFRTPTAEGWRVRRQGYLDQNSLAVALAIFALLADAPADEMLRHLNTNPRTYFKKALKHVEHVHHKRLARLRAKLDER